MKATGIVRRIDDLGRIVIPKEIRKSLRVREGDPLEIYITKEGEIVLKKYSDLGEMKALAEAYVKSISVIAKGLVCVTDCDQVIACAGDGQKEVYGMKISNALENSMKERRVICAAEGEKDFVNVVESSRLRYKRELIYPIIHNGDLAGAVVFMSCDEKAKWMEIEKCLVACAADFLGRQLE